MSGRGEDASEREAIWGIIMLPTHTRFSFTSAHPFSESGLLTLILASSYWLRMCVHVV